MNNKYPWKQAILTGVIVGVLGIVFFSIADNLSKHFAWAIHATTIRGLTGLLTLVILGIGIYTGMINIKANNSGKLVYGQALLAGFIIALTTGIIPALVTIIYCSYMNPGYSAYMISESTKEMAANGKSQAEIIASLPGLRQQWSLGGQIIQALIGQTVCGTIIALVMGLFLKTKNN